MFIKFFLRTTVLLFSLCGVAFAKPVLNIQSWQTDKGTKVYYVKAPEIPMVDVLVAFHAGSSSDGKYLGLAQLTSNMIGEGTTSLSADDIANKFDSLGAQFNSSADRDMSVMHLRSLTKPTMLEKSLSLFSNVISQANFPTKEFSRVKASTLQAIKQSEQMPQSVAAKILFSRVFKGSFYAHPILGTAQSVNALTQKNLKNFYNKYYVAKNTLIVIVGDVNTFQAKAIATQVSTALPKGHAAPEHKFIRDNKGSSVHVNFPSQQTTILMGEVGISYKNPSFFPLVVGNYTLGSGMTSRLFSVVREKYGLTYGIGSYILPLEAKGIYIIGLQTKNSQTEKALSLTKQVINNFLKTGPTENELQAAKNFLVSSFPLKIDNNAKIANYVLTMAFYHLPLNFLDTYREKINAVTLKQVKDAMRQTIKPANFVTVTVGKR